MQKKEQSKQAALGERIFLVVCSLVEVHFFLPLSFVDLRSEMPRRGIHPLVRTATLVLRNGASVSIETVAPATKPVMLSVVSL